MFGVSELEISRVAQLGMENSSNIYNSTLNANINMIDKLNSEILGEVDNIYV